jgi:hypothetical protein
MLLPLRTFVLSHVITGCRKLTVYEDEMAFSSRILIQKFREK